MKILDLEGKPKKNQIMKAHHSSDGRDYSVVNGYPTESLFLTAIYTVGISFACYHHQLYRITMWYQNTTIFAFQDISQGKR